MSQLLYQSHLPARYGIQPWLDGSFTGTARNLWRQGIGGNKEEHPLGEPSIREMSPCHNRIGIASFPMSQAKLSTHNFFQEITVSATQNNTDVFAVLMIPGGNKTSLVQQPYASTSSNMNGEWKQELTKRPCSSLWGLFYVCTLRGSQVIEEPFACLYNIKPKWVILC